MIKFKEIHRPVIALIALLLLSNLGFATFTLSPPKGWDCVEDTNQLPKKVECLYIGTGETAFRPTINVALEKTNSPLDEYFHAAKIYHESEPETICQELGTIKTKSGDAKLLQIDRNSGWGPVRFVQASIIIDQVAYVITGTCLRTEFGTYCPTFFETIQSFHVAK